MNLFRASMCCFGFILLIASGASAQQNTPQNTVRKEKVSGDFYFLLGPSGMPVGLRGSSRNEHWETGIRLKVEYQKLEFNFTPAVVGAATFDNPDRFQFLAGVSFRLWRGLSVQAVLSDAYTLNDIPPADPESRWPTSGINTLWLGGRLDFGKNQNKMSAFARYGWRGNEPVIFTHFTKPYARWHFGMASESKLTENTHLILKPEIYVSNHINIARVMLNLGVERQLHRRLFIGGYYAVYRNFGIPNGTVDYRGLPLRKAADRLFFGIRVPFGNSR